jgi:hypothetical protein
MTKVFQKEEKCRQIHEQFFIHAFLGDRKRARRRHLKKRKKKGEKTKKALEKKEKRKSSNPPHLVQEINKLKPSLKSKSVAK